MLAKKSKHVHEFHALKAAANETVVHAEGDLNDHIKAGIRERGLSPAAAFLSAQGLRDDGEGAHKAADDGTKGSQLLEESCHSRAQTCVEQNRAPHMHDYLRRIMAGLLHRGVG